MHVIAACRVKNTCAPEHATYSIGLLREGIDLAIDRSIRRSWIRCCRRPGLDLLVVQHGVDHTRCVASLTSPLYHSFVSLSPFDPSTPSPFSPFSLAGFQPSLAGSPRRPTLTSIPPPRLSRCSLSSLSLPRPIARSFSFFFFPVSCTRVQEGKVKSKRGERKGEERIKYWILLLAVSYLFFLFFDLCNFVPLRVTRVSTLPVLLLLLSLPLVLFPLLLFVVLVVEEARKNAPFLRISLGMLFIRIRVFFCPFFPSIFLLWSLEGISISRVRGELREIELGSSNPLTHSSACLFSRVLIDSANYSLEHPIPFGLWIRVNFRWNCYFSQCIGFRNISYRYRIDLFSIMKITGTIII